jgi:hypothetical protein
MLLKFTYSKNIRLWNVLLIVKSFVKVLKNIEDLIDIQVDEIGDNSFTVLVNDTDTKWHLDSQESCVKKRI